MTCRAWWRLIPGFGIELRSEQTGHPSQRSLFHSDHAIRSILGEQTANDISTTTGEKNPLKRGRDSQRFHRAVMLAALQAFEASPAAKSVGYDVMINSDEETGSLSSAALIEELARGKLAALTYEPAALPDGTLAHARGGSGNYSVTITGRSAHAGRNPEEGRNAVVAAAFS